MVNIVITGAAMMLLSFLPEMFPKFFGDYACDGLVKEWQGNDYKHISGHCTATWGDSPHIATVHWGIRHIYLFWVGVLLIILNFGRIISKLDAWK